MPTFTEIAFQLVDTARSFHARGWAPATSGNFSTVLSRDPLRLAITASGIVPKAIDGRIRCDSAERSAPQSPDFSVSISMKPVVVGTSNSTAILPDTGVQPSCTSPMWRLEPGYPGTRIASSSCS